MIGVDASGASRSPRDTSEGRTVGGGGGGCTGRFHADESVVGGLWLEVSLIGGYLAMQMRSGGGGGDGGDGDDGGDGGGGGDEGGGGEEEEMQQAEE